uniref:Uncharacterized protein n=1 Tax=Oncorhynchus tshawytscha TaxID=74940 RepID=A0AAZ3P0I9_ONCTS
MEDDSPTLKPRRIQNQNVVHRLERRRIFSGRAGTSLEIYEYQGCQAAEDLLLGQDGETLANGNDQRSLNIRGRLFERFFHYCTSLMWPPMEST